MSKKHKCKDCGTVRLHPNKQLCEPCRVKHNIETIARSRKNALVKYHVVGYKPRVPKEKKCKTDDCQAMVTGRNLYCAECKKTRHNEVLKRYRGENKHTYVPTPKPATDMGWLNGINAYLKSRNGVYVDKHNEMPPYRHESKILRVRI